MSRGTIFLLSIIIAIMASIPSFASDQFAEKINHRYMSLSNDRSSLPELLAILVEYRNYHAYLGENKNVLEEIRHLEDSLFFYYSSYESAGETLLGGYFINDNSEKCNFTIRYGDPVLIADAFDNLRRRFELPDPSNRSKDLVTVRLSPFTMLESFKGDRITSSGYMKNWKIVRNTWGNWELTRNIPEKFSVPSRSQRQYECKEICMSCEESVALMGGLLFVVGIANIAANALDASKTPAISSKVEVDNRASKQCYIIEAEKKRIASDDPSNEIRCVSPNFREGEKFVIQREKGQWYRVGNFPSQQDKDSTFDAVARKACMCN